MSTYILPPVLIYKVGLQGLRLPWDKAVGIQALGNTFFIVPRYPSGVLQMFRWLVIYYGGGRGWLNRFLSTVSR